MKTIELCGVTPVAFGDYERRRSDNDFSAKKYLGPIPNGAFAVRGYLNYLALAWKKHYAVVLNPTDVWHFILCELTATVAKEPKKYANLFTTTPDQKQEIVVLTGDVESIDPERVVRELKDRVPSNVDDFLPFFTTDNQWSRLAMNVAFCDLVSPYYSYSTMLCGIPAIEIGGFEEDWILIQEKLSNLAPLFEGNLRAYINRCCELVYKIKNACASNNVSFFKAIASLKQCGSGHQFEMTGWMTHFLNRSDFTQPVMVDGMPTQTSKMTYTNLETQRKFELYAGIFYVTPRENFLVPNYNAVRLEITNKGKPPTKEDKVEAVKSALKFISTPVKDPDDEVVFKIREPGIHVDVTKRMANMVIPKDFVQEKKCKQCQTPMTKFIFAGWKHALCPSCAFLYTKALSS